MDIWLWELGKEGAEGKINDQKVSWEEEKNNKYLWMIYDMFSRYVPFSWFVSIKCVEKWSSWWNVVILKNKINKVKISVCQFVCELMTDLPQICLMELGRTTG